MLPIGSINTQNYERQARPVNFFANPGQIPPLGTPTENYGTVAQGGLENKTGTANQSAILPGGRSTIMARVLDFSA